MVLKHLAPFLPGRFVIEKGSVRDYDRLAPFHYCAARPATFACICIIRYLPERRSAMHEAPGPVGIGVLSYPTPSCRARERALGTLELDPLARLHQANQLVRTISRVIVHPQFRSLDLAGAIIAELCRTCPTRYIESVARMGALHPMFKRAGLVQVDPADPTYFLLDRKQTNLTHSDPPHVPHHSQRTSQLVEAQPEHRRAHQSGVPQPSGAV